MNKISPVRRFSPYVMHRSDCSCCSNSGFILLTFFFLLFSGFSIAQKTNTSNIISGVVRNEKGELLEGVTVTLKNSAKATFTKADGAFQISVPNGKGVLVFTSVGYATQERSVTNNKLVAIVLIEEASSLNDVVVVGYGTQRRKDVTGSVVKANIEEMQKAPVRSFDEALAGRMAGVQVTSQDGQPGTPINIVIRGGNSLTQDNSPLYVIDGFPMENPDNNVLNPSDIESIEVLKDASATAIYGARGANGVIMITTKKGKVGDPVIEYQGSYGIQKNTTTQDLLNPYEFVKLQLEVNRANAIGSYFPGGYTDQALDSFKTVAPVDFQKQLYKTASLQNHSISIRGGTSKTKYSVSGSVLNQEGTIINTGYKRYQGRVNLDQDLTSKLKFGINTNYTHIEKTGIPISTDGAGEQTLSVLYAAWAYRPITNGVYGVNLDELLFDPNIDPSTDYRVNPVIEAREVYDKTIGNTLVSNTYLNYSFTKNLQLRVTGGITSTISHRDLFNNSNTRTGNPRSPQYAGINGSIIYSNNYTWVNENTLTYNKAFNKNNILTVVGGFTQQGGKSNGFGSAAVYLPNENLGLSGLDEGTPLKINSSSSNWQLRSFLGRANYNLMGRYLFTASFRSDGSSKFAKENRWGYFPSAAFAWRFSNEKFMDKLQFVSDAKLRLGYGVTGNNRVSDFAYSSQILSANNTGYSFNDGYVTGTIPAVLGNPALKWETTAQSNIGLDLSLWKERLSFTTDYYYKKTYNLLLNADLPYSLGYSQAYKNIGKVSNQGIEFTVNAAIIKNKKFNWTSNFNISFNRSKVLELTENQESIVTSVRFTGNYNNAPSYIAKIGQPVAQFYGVIFDGLYQYSDFDQLANGTYVLKDNVSSSLASRSSVKPGYQKFRDLNGDGVINNLDFTVIGNPNPKHIGGFSNTLTYGAFDLNIFLQWSYGNDVLNANRIAFEGGGTSMSFNKNQFASYANRWTPTNTNTALPVATQVEPGYFSSRVIEDASFLRLKTVSLGYNLPKKYVKHVKLKALRAYASGQNLYTLTKYTGFDAEVSVRNTSLTPGFDYAAYPRPVTIAIGVNASF